MVNKQITIVVAVIKNSDGEILLAKRNQPEIPEIHGKWELVGGGIEFGETAEEALLREVKEESGLQVEIVRLLPKVITSHQKIVSSDENLQVIIINYECKIISGEPKIGLDKEVLEFKFVKLKDIKKYDCLPNLYDIAELSK